MLFILTIFSANQILAQDQDQDQGTDLAPWAKSILQPLKQPIFVTIKRTSNGIEEIIDNGAFDFQLVKGMTRADQFLYNWLY